MVSNILLNAVTLFSQDCSLKRARGSKKLAKLQKVKLSIKFECRSIHKVVEAGIDSEGLKASEEILEEAIDNDWEESKENVTV